MLSEIYFAVECGALIYNERTRILLQKSALLKTAPLNPHNLEHLIEEEMKKKVLGLSAVDDLDDERRVKILSKIDSIRELGVGESVSLPQVCV
jgi:hypothetical protein